MTPEQTAKFKNLCDRYEVPFDPADYRPAFDLPDGWLSGWVGGLGHGFTEGGNRQPATTIFVGVSPEGDAHS